MKDPLPRTAGASSSGRPAAPSQYETHGAAEGP